ncbi:hypothetical protein GDO86_017514 [Hymenochirus boettgeri]|uniref:Uncharacterized protein n=1 Tax=Hymenochirus boettgeri TaxID=247094 RepID=A0A8T2INS7_9PIPI|nr:hypothetical protein GDO86_017514 [Hymenochirus boettgeri]
MSVNYLPWRKEKSFKPVDQMISSIAFSNVVNSGTVTVNILWSFFPTENIVDVLRWYADFSNPWLASCLCFFFFVKINDFKPGYLAQLKSKIDPVIPWVILGAHLSSIFNCVILAAMNITFIDLSSSILIGQNLNMIDGSWLVLSLYLYTSAPIICNRTWGNIGTPNLKVHQRAARILTSFLIFYLLFFFFTIGGDLFIPTSSLYLAFAPVTWLCSSIQATILILGNTRLKQTCVKIFNGRRRKEFNEEGNSVDLNQTP